MNTSRYILFFLDKKITDSILEFSNRLSGIIGYPIKGRIYRWFTNNYYITIKERRWCIKNHIIWEVRPISKYFPSNWYVKIDGKNTRILPYCTDRDKILDELLIEFNKRRVKIPIVAKEDTFKTDRYSILDI